MTQTAEEITALSKLVSDQRKVFRRSFKSSDGKNLSLVVYVRYDDSCNNGYNTFAITGDLYDHNKVIISSGCVHDTIVQHYPEFVPYLKWHLCSSNGPMHYIADTIYLAGERDHWGCLKGEPRYWKKSVKFKDFPIEFCFSREPKFVIWLEVVKSRNVSGKPTPEQLEIVVVPNSDAKIYGDKYTFSDYRCQWHECPFDSKREIEQWRTALLEFEYEIVRFPSAFGEGKKRDLDAARRAAVWSDATDEDLTAPGLRERLEARLPALLLEFKAAVEHFGFTF